MTRTSQCLTIYKCDITQTLQGTNLWRICGKKCHR